MSKPCRLTFFAYKSKVCLPGIYDKDDLINGIDYAEGLIEMGFTFEPHDEFDLKGYIEWAKHEVEGVRRRL